MAEDLKKRMEALIKRGQAELKKLPDDSELKAGIARLKTLSKGTAGLVKTLDSIED